MIFFQEVSSVFHGQSKSVKRIIYFDVELKTSDFKKMGIEVKLIEANN